MGSDLRKSIEKTLSYADFFDFPLTLDKLHLWLISPEPVSLSSITSVYKKPLTQLQKKLLQQRLENTKSKLRLAHRVVSLLALFPTIKLIALTGSLAMGNAQTDDDIDLMVVTDSDTLWLTRLFVIPLVGLFFRRRQPQSFQSVSDSFCFNLWLDQSALAVPSFKQNLYTAHEVLQIQPLYDRSNYYSQFLHANSWTRKYLANAYFTLTTSITNSTSKGERSIPINFLLKPLNRFAFKFQHLYMKHRITKETITLHSAFFHPRDLSGALEDHLNS